MSKMILNGTCKILRSTGLSAQHVYPILNMIEKWIRSNGEEWTVNRLKMMKLGFVNLMAGKGYSLPDKSWIKHDNKGPKGPFSVLVKMKKAHKALSAFMVYSSFISRTITEQQKLKFLSGVNHQSKPFDEDLAWELIDEFNSFFKSSKKSWMPLRTLERKEIRVPAYRFSEDMWEEPTFISTKNSMDAILSSAKAPFMADWIRSRGKDAPEVADLYHRGKTIPNKYVGKIGFIQEPGYKLRSVANPLPIYQIALSEFGSQLYNNLRLIPQDCTFDQDKGILEIQDYLKGGGELVAFDLSSATDTFPFEYTKLMLLHSNLINDNDLFLWEQVSRGTWSSTLGDIRWKTGQPLGVFPSFAAFALSHHALARRATSGFYRILGDDIVINKNDAPKMKELYDRLGCIISESKSIDSKILTEFAGRLITKDRVYSQPKWFEISDRSFIDLARQVGPNIMGLLRPRQKKIIRLLAEVPSSLHPWGMNWNPKGKPFNQRVEESQEVLLRLGLKEDLIPQASIKSKSLSDLPTKIKLRSSEPAMVLKFGDDLSIDDLVEQTARMRGLREDVKVDPSNGGFEEQLLDFLQINRVDGIKLLSGWFIDQSFVPSDPRGQSTLLVAEKKLHDVRKDLRATYVAR